VLLYEVYDDEAAFDAHLQTPHLAAFRSGIENLVVSRQVRRLTRIHG
jgi:quinol monooxygenase YgiN